MSPMKERQMRVIHLRHARAAGRASTILLAGLLSGLVSACVCLAPPPVAARAAVSSGASDAQAVRTAGSGAGGSGAGGSSETGSSLETAASKAGETGRKVAMSLIGLAFAVAGIVLAFRRDFKEAAGVFAVGIVAVLLATPAGIGLLRDTVNSLFGTQ
jgi:hypothetical protein